MWSLLLWLTSPLHGQPTGLLTHAVAAGWLAHKSTTFDIRVDEPALAALTLALHVLPAIISIPRTADFRVQRLVVGAVGLWAAVHVA